ncbi:MAG: ABC transporter permease subunit [bacterium]
MSNAPLQMSFPNFGSRFRDFLNDREAQVRLARQIGAVTRMSVRRYLFTRYMWVLFYLGAIPVVLVTCQLIRALFLNVSAGYFVANWMPPADVNVFLQVLFRFLYIHFIIFWVATLFGFSLLRQEIDDQTLHYLFLQPIGRPTVILSKFLGFLAVTWIYLSATFLFSYFALMAPHGIKGISGDLFEAGRALTLIKECFIMLLALAMYGSISMVLGSIFKSSGAGLLFYMWEGVVPWLPSTLKFFTISHYLQALTPERSVIPRKAFELLGDLPSGLRCSVTLSLVLAAMIIITVFLVRRRECVYSVS